MRARLLTIAVLAALLVAGGTWATLNPLLTAQLDDLRRVTSEQHVARLELIAATLGLFDVVLGAAVIFLLLNFFIGRPLSEEQRRVAAVMAREGRRLQDEGTFGSLSSAALQLEEVLQKERATSERRLAELTLNADQKTRLQAELVAADRLATVGKLAAGVAHEVGNPLSGILGYLSVLRMREKGNEATTEVVDRIEAEVKRIDGIVRGLLEMGRPSRGKAQPIDVRPVVDGCVTMVTSMKENAGVAISVECPETAWLRAEPGPLAQVLVNLLINGCQALGGKGHLWVRVVMKEGGAEILVEDDGPGLPKDVLHKLFTPFFTTKPPGQGTGLGLAVSRHLLSQFDGKLSATNRPGGGACFTISLPAP